MTAVLNPPTTTYTVTYYSQSPIGQDNSTASSSGARTYTWTNSNPCGTFTPNGPTAVWNHGDTTNCSHETPAHPGTISVVMGGLDNETSSTGYATCEYPNGSADGKSDACYVSSFAPAGQPPARTSPGFEGVLALAAVGAALFAVRRRP
jgi:hypothetical protein